MKYNLIKRFIISLGFALSLLLAFPKEISFISSNVPILPNTVQMTAEDCLTANIYFEARSESLQGMKAIAAVTYNRLLHKNYPADLCNVVFQYKQFSWTHMENIGIISKVLSGNIEKLSLQDQKKYMQAKVIAKMPMQQLTRLLPKGTIFYHTVRVKPYWAKHKVKVAQVGSHIFYKG